MNIKRQTYPNHTCADDRDMLCTVPYDKGYKKPQLISRLQNAVSRRLLSKRGG
jgi:hypothetical protein